MGAGREGCVREILRLYPAPQRPAPGRQKHHIAAVNRLLPAANRASPRNTPPPPPFNDVRARRAILTAMSQEDYMRAVVGDDALWKPLPSFLTPGTPLSTEEGGEILKGQRDLDAAKRLLAASGYAGQPVTCVVAQDIAITKAMGD